jgi:hypothetical protein
MHATLDAISMAQSPLDALSLSDNLFDAQQVGHYRRRS